MRTQGKFHVVVRAAALATVVVLAAAACGGDGDDPATATDEERPASTAPTAPSGTSTGDEDAALPPLPDRFATSTSETYADPASWICSPLTDDDPCDVDLDTTVVRADGTTERRDVEVAVDAPVDCFYVYPTVNMVGGGIDEAMAADTAAETAVVGAQLAPFGEVCRIWAPLYRQLTMDGFGAPNVEELQATAYQDVHEAFAHYLATANEGRPIVLIGHSQGSFHLNTLLAEEFDGDEAMTARLVSALLIGGRTTTAEGSDVGGSFDHLPACRADDQLGCVIGWNAAAPGSSDQIRTTWGGAAEGEQRLCTNPAALGGGAAPLRTRLQADRAATGLLQVDTPYLELDGALVGECVTDGAATLLEVTVADGWPAEQLARLSTNVDFWGLHIVDVNLGLGDLVELVRAQSAAIGT